MATPDWPASLPAPNTDYSYAPQPSVVESNMENGYVLSRRRLIAKPTIIMASYTFSKSQMAVFESFFEFTLLSGLLQFTTPLINGQGLNRVKAQIVQSGDSPWIANYQDVNYFNVSMKLRTILLPIAGV